MGLFGDLMSKVGAKMEAVMGKNMSGESKEAYEKEQQANDEQILEQETQKAESAQELDKHKTTATASDLKNLETLLQTIAVIDQNKQWVGGFDNFKANQNAKAANLFSGNKNIKVLSACDNAFYLSKYHNGSFYAYQMFTKQDVVKLQIEGMLSKKIKLELANGTTYSVDVSENKEMVAVLKQLLQS